MRSDTVVTVVHIWSLTSDENSFDLAGNIWKDNWTLFNGIEVKAVRVIQETKPPYYIGKYSAVETWGKLSVILKIESYHDANFVVTGGSDVD